MIKPLPGDWAHVDTFSFLDCGSGPVSVNAECGPGTELEKKLNQIIEGQQLILRLLGHKEA